MDKPRHPLVTRPWKIRQTQPTNCNLPPIKTGKERRRVDSIANRQKSFIQRKPASGFQEDGLRLTHSGITATGIKMSERMWLEFFGLTPLRARE